MRTSFCEERSWLLELELSKERDQIWLKHSSYCCFFQAFKDYGRETKLIYIQRKRSAVDTRGSSTLLPFLSSLHISTPLLHRTLLSRCDQTCQDNAGAHPREDARRHRLSPLRAFLTCLPVLGDKLYLRRNRKTAFMGRRKKIEVREQALLYLLLILPNYRDNHATLFQKIFRNFQSWRRPSFRNTCYAAPSVTLLQRRAEAHFPSDFFFFFIILFFAKPSD